MIGEDSSGDDPPRFLTDEDFANDIIKGLRLRLPLIDIVRVQDVGLLHAPDPDVLAFAREHDRILLTHDSHTMPVHFVASLPNIPQGHHSPGVMWLEQETPIGRAIAAVELVWSCSSHAEWRDRFTYLPL
jgi:uncharacterized protein DUF5615